ncbi:hypothetical protein EDD86DRAFT_275463, partial [Gorgonomyces haynaldii]
MPVKVFVSKVDTPLGHNLTRILSQTPVGSRIEVPEEEEEPPVADPNQETPPAKKEKPPKENYTIIGSLGFFEPDESLNARPTQILETGDKKKDAARKEALEKNPTPSVAPKWVSSVVDSRNQEVLKETLLASDIIIYDLVSSLEETSFAISFLAENADKFEKPKTFIGISTVMTWARTKIEVEDADSLTEDEFRRRKGHPNFKNHLALEKEITKQGKKANLKTYVIASGLVYHAGDSLFHYLLRDAWHNEPALICYGEGNNVLPCIHLDDLVTIIVEVVETNPEQKYLVAVDESKNNLMEITKAVSEALGSGQVKSLSQEDAFLDKRLTQQDFDMITCGLRIDAGHIKEMSIEWKYESGFIENLPTIIQEYKDARGLWPIKIMIHGPPGSRKTHFAYKLADHYKLHLISPDQVMQEAVERLEQKLTIEPADDAQAEELEAEREVLNELKESYKANNGKYASTQVIAFVREKLRSMPCRNQGYVLDGFPSLMDEATEIFKPNDEDAKDDGFPADEAIAPDFIFNLEASDNFIKQRVMRLPESAIAGTKYSEEALTKHLDEFRKNNTDENTVLNFFDEIEIHPITLNVELSDLQPIEEQMLKTIGKPRNYGPTPEKIAEEKRLLEAARVKAEAAAAEERSKREQEELERHKRAVAEWNSKLEEVRQQEQEVLQTQSLPLRNYLMKHVIPTLTAGLIEVAKIRPEDPVDYLAEFMFKQNPLNNS